MKKYLDYIVLGCCILFPVLVLLLMLAPGTSVTLLGTTSTASVYDCMSNGDSTCVGLVFALIFTIITLVEAVGLCAIKCLKINFKFGWIIAFAAALFAFVAGILFFCIKGLLDVADSELIKIGAGAIMSGIFSLFGAGAFAFYGVISKK